MQSIKQNPAAHSGSIKSESYHLFRVKTRRQAVKQSSGWKCFVYDFFNNLRFIGKGKYRKDAVGEAKEFEKGFAREQEAERDAFRKRNRAETDGKRMLKQKMESEDALKTARHQLSKRRAKAIKAGIYIGPRPFGLKFTKKQFDIPSSGLHNWMDGTNRHDTSLHSDIIESQRSGLTKCN